MREWRFKQQPRVVRDSSSQPVDGITRPAHHFYKQHPTTNGSTSTMTSIAKHDIALGWLIVRRRSLVAGREKIVEQADASDHPEKYIAALDEKDMQIENIDHSTDVLLRDGGYFAAAAAIDDGTVITGTIIDG